VVAWVDGNDTEWMRQFRLWSKETYGDKRNLRYRDWGTLCFLFRAFEKYAAWVNKIHFVTWGHLPRWLNACHPKLHIVNHRDFLRPEHLPVFNSHAIEVNFHRIAGLSEKFVYFNDDTFILKNVCPERFFREGLPRDIFALNAISPSHPIAHININNVRVINRHFTKRIVMSKYLRKWLFPQSGMELIKTLLLLLWPQFTGFYDPHQPQPFLKSVFEEVSAKEKEVLDRTSCSKFRNNNDVSQYLFRYWQLVKGKFIPVSFSDSFSTSIRSTKSAYLIADIIRKKRYRLFCINDAFELDNEGEFQNAKEIINKAFEEILPEKSKFEL